MADGATVSTSPEAVWAGHDFLGWFTESEGGTQVYDYTLISTNMTWYAHWQAASSWGGTETIDGRQWSYRVENGEVTITSAPEGEGECEIPASIQGLPTVRIGDWSFNSRRYSSIRIPEGVTDIGYEAFSGCPALEEVELPHTVTNIGDYAFYEDTGLKKVVIPENVVAAGDNAFGGCSNIEDLSILARNMETGPWWSNPFRGVGNLLRVTLPGRNFGLSLSSVTKVQASLHLFCAASPTR